MRQARNAHSSVSGAATRLRKSMSGGRWRVAWSAEHRVWSKGPENSTAVSRSEATVAGRMLVGERPRSDGSRDNGAPRLHSVAASGSHVMVHEAVLASMRQTMVDGWLRGLEMRAKGRT